MDITTYIYTYTWTTKVKLFFEKWISAWFGRIDQPNAQLAWLRQN